MAKNKTRSAEYTSGYRVARSMCDNGNVETARRIAKRASFEESYGADFAAGFRKYLANH